jgi:hypothetical protein
MSSSKTLNIGTIVLTFKNIQYQQNLSERAIAIVVLGIPQWPILRPHVDRMVAAVNAAKPGTYCEVDIPDR